MLNSNILKNYDCDESFICFVINFTKQFIAIVNSLAK